MEEKTKMASRRQYMVLDYVSALTFDRRQDIPEDYKSEYFQAIKARCLGFDELCVTCK
jgi:hypothetical protein